MGGVGNFLFGGSSQKSNNSSSGSSSNQSTQTSANNAVNASASGSNNINKALSSSMNQGYAPISGAMMPTLGYTASAGNAIASLLGLPQSNYSYQQTAYAMPNAPAPVNTSVNLPNLSSLIASLAQS